MSDAVTSWITALIILAIGFGAGWIVFDPDEDEATPVQTRAASECYLEFDTYVRHQIEWLRNHNKELESIIELNTHNREVENGDAEKKF